MKILVVSGFLGAGKTTFIKEMSKQTGRDFVVMENEYAEAGMDRAFLEEEKQINVWQLTDGCICCSMKNDFATSILTIANTLDPEYLIVEPTGIGVLSSVMENIRQIEYERITLLSPVTIIDANTFARCMAEYRIPLTGEKRISDFFSCGKLGNHTPDCGTATGKGPQFPGRTA